MASRPELKITIEECIGWVRQLETFSDMFYDRGDDDVAKMMEVCSMLMNQLADEVQAKKVNPFPVTPGRC